ncbi:MAG TPA: multicopper oxidase domain-containing protein [Terriglobales bacterium]|nr:multicopper oxidase domain-containing protein [Terriglobales bacterium]
MRYACALWTLMLVATLFTPLFACAADQSSLPVIVANDNRTAAGTLKDGVLRLRLELRQARWYAEAADGVYEDVYAFAEQGRPPQSSGPLIRVPQGARIHVSLHNLLPIAAKIYGLHSYPGDPDQAVQLAAGEIREVQFDAGEPGTYMYWATTSDAHLNDPEAREGEEGLLSGAFIVDPPGGRGDDRIFVIEEWAKNNLVGGGDVIFAINGKSWPATEHLIYKAGETVHWRIINTTSTIHAMHLHGFYFTVDGVGDLGHFVAYSASQRRQAVTEGIDSGHSFNMTWTPERAGNWLFHCHMITHMSLLPTLHPPNTTPDIHAARHDNSAGMGGLVIGVTVLPGAAPKAVSVESRNVRKLQLVISDNPEKVPLYRLEIYDSTAPLKPDEKKQPALLGPPIVLTRGEPAEIEVKNQSSSPTAIHWHGIELESYYDGVAGWSGSGQQITPPIAPGSSFVARFTPPRAGTFIYHTHWHDKTQIRNGLYGPLIVLEPGQKLDPDQDRTFLFSVGIYPPLGFMMLINGQPGPDPLPLHRGKRYRFRLINITDDGSDLRVRLLFKSEPISWRVIAKDGADLPPEQIVTSRADMFLTVGATCDVEVTLDQPGPAGLQISSDGLADVAMYPFIAVK